MQNAQANVELAEEIAQYYDDPLGFVQDCFPWGEPGELQGSDGPDEWQRLVLAQIAEKVKANAFNGADPVDPIRDATASGHGIGKSTLVAWIVCWIMSTRPGSQGTVTANTYVQLETKTWAAIQKWGRLCITSHWFNITRSRFEALEAPEDWFCTPQTCREENSEAFAGQHSKTATSFYIFDEASLIPEAIWNVAEGGLTDGEPMIFAFGNPTRNTGKFYRITFGNEKHRWTSRAIDSRTCAFPNKKTIEEWLQDYGEDSDFFRVRVRGLPPRASETQFIDQTRIWAAQQRPLAVIEDEPWIAGVDLSAGGSAWNVVRFRRGMDGRSRAPIRIPGEHARDRAFIVAKLAEVLKSGVAMMFVDSAFGAFACERLKQLGFKNVVEINFGGKSPDIHQGNMRAYMWNKCKDWLVTGALDPKDDKMAADLAGPGFHLNRQNQLLLESKEDMAKRGEASPDDGDALCLTFAHPVGPELSIRAPEPVRQVGYSPYA